MFSFQNAHCQITDTSASREAIINSNCWQILMDMDNQTEAITMTGIAVKAHGQQNSSILVSKSTRLPLKAHQY